MFAVTTWSAKPVISGVRRFQFRPALRRVIRRHRSQLSKCNDHGLATVYRTEKRRPAGVERLFATWAPSPNTGIADTSAPRRSLNLEPDAFDGSPATDLDGRPSRQSGHCFGELAALFSGASHGKERKAHMETLSGSSESQSHLRGTTQPNCGNPRRESAFQRRCGGGSPNARLSVQAAGSCGRKFQGRADTIHAGAGRRACRTSCGQAARRCGADRRVEQLIAATARGWRTLS